MVWNSVIVILISILCLVLLYIILVVIIDYYKIPVFRLKRYRILKEHHVCSDYKDELYEYYRYRIQETYFIFWSDVPYYDIPYRNDGELNIKNKQRQDNYFEKFENALISKNEIRKELEIKYTRIKLKKKDEIIKD